jgi:cadmium resistance protein CadD (predicted permease)
VGFGVLIDNMIKELTCLHEFMSRNLIVKLVLNEMAHVLQASVFIPLALYICVTSKTRKERIEQGIDG